MEPPCGKCKPELKIANVPFLILYNYCQDQYIMGPAGPIGLNMLAIEQSMQDYQIPQDEKIDFSLKVRHIASIVISARAEEAEAKRKKK